MVSKRIIADEIAASEQTKLEDQRKKGLTPPTDDGRLVGPSYQIALRDLPDPTAIPDLMLPRKEEVLPSSVVGGELIDTGMARNRFAQDLEQAYYRNRGQVPVGWLIQQEPEDLAYFKDPDFAEAAGPVLVNQGLALYNDYLYRQELERQAEERFEEEVRKAQALDQHDAFQGQSRGVGMLLGGEDDKDAAVQEMLDAKLPGKEFRQEDLDAILNPEISEGRPGFIETGLEFMGQAWKSVEQLLMLGSLPIAPDKESNLIGILGPEAAEELLGITAPESAELAEAREELRRMQLGENDEALKDKVLQGMLPQAVWRDYQETQPDVIEHYQMMYGDMAYQGFLVEFQDIRDNPDLDEQLRPWIEDGIIAPLQEYIVTLEEANYRDSNAILNFLDTWGSVSLGLAATASAAFLELTSDREFDQELNVLSVEYWKNIVEEVEKGGFTPSGVFGYEGTAAGMMIDFLGGAIFDITNWLFMPGVKAGVNALSQARAVRQIMRSPGLRMYLNDAPALLAHNAGATIGKASVLAPWAEVGMAGDFMHAAGYADNVLPAKPYLSGPKGAASAEMKLSSVVAMLDDVQTEAWLNLSVDNIQTSLKNSGFHEPIQVVYDPKTGQFFVEDGLKRLRAAQNIEGLDMVPVTIRVAAADEFAELVPPTASNVPTNFHGSRTSLEGVELKAIGSATRSAAEANAVDQLFGPGFYTTDTRAVAETPGYGGGEGGRINAVRWTGEDPPRVLDLRESANDTMRSIIRSYLDDPESILPHHADDLGVLHEIEEMLDNPTVTGERLYNAFQRTLRGLSTDEAEFFARNFQLDLADHYDVLSHQGGVRIPGSELHTASVWIHPEKLEILDVTDFKPGQVKGQSYDELGVPEPTDINTRRLGGAEFANPNSVFPDEFLGRTGDKAKLLELTEQLLMMGGDIPMARQTWAAQGLGRFVREIARTGSAGDLAPYLKTTFNSDYVPVGGIGGSKRLMEFVDFIGTRDAAWTNHWLQRILEHERTVASTRARQAQLTKRMKDLEEVDQLLATRGRGANGWRELVDAGVLDEAAAANLISVEEARGVVAQSLDDTKADLSALEPNQIDWQEFAEELFNDYNREFIATNPEWADRVGADGLVPWSEIHRGTNIADAGFPVGVDESTLSARLGEKAGQITDDVAAKANYTRGEAERIIGQFAGSTVRNGGVRLPATPIELLAATERGGARYTKWSQQIYATQIRQSVHLVDAMWKANVLATPRTFMVMSVDELMSMMHMGGMDFVRRYLQLRSDYLGSRLNSFFREGEFFRVGPGSAKMSDAAIERIRTLKDVPQEFRAYERFLAESVNNEVVWMERNQLGYKTAAEQYAQQWVDNEAFRAYLRGREGFRQWWDESATAEEWRLNNKIMEKDANGNSVVRPYDTWEEAYNAADLVWQRLERAAVQQGLEDPAEFRRAFADTAAQIDADPSGRVYTVPQWTWDYFGPIPGRRPVYPGASLAWETAARVFEAGAANPANFRQGLASEMMRRKEQMRIKKLLESQGRKVISDHELIEILRVRGISPLDLDPMTSLWLDQQLAKEGIFTESWVARLSEQRARDFVDDMTYSFEQGSRFSAAGQGVFPFGRAWGEMYARWGRQLFTRGVVRAPFRNIPVLGDALQFVADLSPVNPRTAGFISRVAATDLEITGGLYGERKTQADFSPLTFLPTASDGGLSVLVPGLGPAPILALDEIVENMFDPVEDPQAYQRAIDAISDFIPGMSLHGRESWQRLIGSGTIGLLLNSVSDLSMGLFHNNNRNQGRFTGNIGQELRRSRAVSAQFADPEFLDTLLSMNDPESVRLLLAAAWRDANQDAAQLGLYDNLSSWGVPVRGALDPSLDELYGVWIQTAQANDSIFDIAQFAGISEEQLKLDGDLLKQYGDSIRRQFFLLPGWQREALIAANPTLAVNMVSTWEWSDQAPLDLPDRDAPYAVGRSSVDGSLGESLDRHNVYVQRGWVVPRDTATRGFHILGRALSARQNSARQLYEFSAEAMNDLLWNGVVSAESKAALDIALALPEFERLGITEPRQLWERWGTNREVLEDALLETAGLERGTEEGDELVDAVRAAIKVPTNEQAWSTEWRGDEMDNFSKRSLQTPVLIPEEAQQIASLLGIDVEAGMRGEDFIQTLIDYRSQAEGGAWNAVRNQYDQYQEDRGRNRANAIQSLIDLSQNRTVGLSPEYRGQVDEFVQWAEVQNENSYHGGISRAKQDEAVDKFMRLMTTGRDAPVLWEEIWRDAYQDTFGPLNWTPPEPLAPIDEDGNWNENAWKPYIKMVVDGDTLLVSKNLGPSIIGGQLRPEVDAGETQLHRVRLLGVMAADYGASYSGTAEEARADEKRLEDALREARRNGDTIWLVRDPDYAGSHTDPFGRELAWLWIGDQPYYFPDELKRGEG